MMAHLIVLVLIGCTIAVAYGVAVLPRKLRALFESTRPNAVREQATVALAHAEFLQTPSRLRHLEIEATKRGDLLAAARLAERAEVIRG